MSDLLPRFEGTLDQGAVRDLTETLGLTLLNGPACENAAWKLLPVGGGELYDDECYDDLSRGRGRGRTEATVCRSVRESR